MPTGSRTFRVFVSSTFDDLRAERDALHEVFEQLSAACESRGARFQAIDLRWGVREEATLDHRTMDLCLTEVERCRSTGIKPNFIVLLGSRYGWCPVPARIDRDEFEALCRFLTPEERRLVESWYECDFNAVPPQFILKPRTGVFVDGDRWKSVEAVLHGALERAAANLPEADAAKYRHSATHQEILAGLKTEEDRRHVFAFARTPDNDEKRIADLKEELAAALGPNMRSFSTLGELQSGVFERLREVIDAEIDRLDSEAPWDHESRLHAEFAHQQARAFIGRRDLAEAVRHYVAGSDSRPLLVYGESGSGKSALLAHASAETMCVRRFVGISPRASTGVGLLAGLCEEMDRLQSFTRPPAATFDDLVAAFGGCLGRASADQPLVIYVDALNQLPPRDPAITGAWLPARLPPHCRVVLSCTDIPPGLTDAIHLRVEPWTASDASTALDRWLGSSRRTLLPGQRAVVLDAFDRCRLPLYLKLAFEEAHRWRSFDPPETWRLGDGLAGIISRLFRRLAESDHGDVLVSRSLVYLGAARYGLSEGELLRTLSADPDVLEDFSSRAKHPPPHEGLPTVIWSRLNLDLAPYLAERVVNGATLITFYHQSMREAVDRAFLATSMQRRAAHARLASMFDKSGDPQGDRSWGGSARALAELPVHLAASNQTGLSRLLSSIRYLERRVASGDLQDALIDYDRLAEQDSLCLALRDFLRARAGKLGAKPNVLFSTIHHEAPGLVREAASKQRTATWPKAWLATSPISIPSAGATGAGRSLEVTGKVTFNPRTVVGLGAGAEMAFYLEQLGRLRCVDLTSCRELPHAIPIGSRPPLAIAPSNDAGHLAVADDEGRLSVLELTWGADRSIARSRERFSERYLIPDFEPPIMRWAGHELLFQHARGHLTLVRFPEQTRKDIDLPEDLSAELSGAVHVAGRWRVTLRSGEDSLVWDPETGACLRIERTDVVCAAVSGGGLVLGLSDGTIAEVRTNGSLVLEERLPIGCVPDSIVDWDGQIVWTQPNGFHWWDPVRNSAVFLSDGHAIFDNVYARRIRSLSIGAGDRLFGVADSCAFVARASSTADAGLFNIDTVMSGERGTYALQRRDEALCVVDCERQTVRRLADHGRLMHFAAIDAGGRLLSASVKGGGVLMSLSTADVQPAESPISVNAIAAAGAYFWMVDRDGVIYRSDGVAQERVADVSVHHLAGPRLVICGEWLIVHGSSSEASEHNPHGDPQHSVVFYRLSTTGRDLTKAGFRTFAKSLGILDAITDLPSRELMFVFSRERGEQRVLVGTPEALAAGAGTVRECSFGGSVQEAFRDPGGSTIYALVDHDLIAIDPETMTEQCRLTSVRPFTALAPKEGGGSLVVASRQTLFQCRIEEARCQQSVN